MIITLIWVLSATWQSSYISPVNLNDYFKLPPLSSDLWYPDLFLTLSWYLCFLFHWENKSQEQRTNSTAPFTILPVRTKAMFALRSQWTTRLTALISSTPAVIRSILCYTFTLSAGVVSFAHFQYYHLCPLQNHYVHSYTIKLLGLSLFIVFIFLFLFALEFTTRLSSTLTKISPLTKVNND